MLISLFGALAWIAAANGQGTFEAITDYTPGSEAAVIPGTGGWTFQPQVDITITDLGCLDVLLALQGTTEIGLWTDDGQSLVPPVSIVPTNSSPTQPQYASVTNVLLVAGQTYRIGAFSPGSGGIMGMSLAFPAPSTNGSVTLSPDIKLGSYAYSTDNTFSFPGTLGANGQMLLGPTFLYTKAIPEPAVMALLCLGGLGWWFGRRRGWN